jgi:hypothetical protein
MNTEQTPRNGLGGFSLDCTIDGGDMKTTTSQDQIQLTAEDGLLCTPHSALMDVFLKQHFEEDPPLLAHYPAGDYDTVNWPNPNEEILRTALFGARETGLIPDVRSVILPDGSEFII